jgi:DedD protein
MALFKFRKNADLNNGTPDSAEPVESVEALRKKTLHRLIGSGILVVVGVVIFSVGFDRQPRPIPVDVNIRIPSKEGQSPLVIGAVTAPTAASSDVATTATPASASQPAAVASAPLTSSAPVIQVAPPAPQATVAPTSPTPVAAPSAKAVPAVAVPVAAPAPAPQAKLAEKSATSKSTTSSDAERAAALLEGKTVDSKDAASGERFVVQVGAFADVAKARQARIKLEKAGLKTYTQVAQTSEGKRIRVRVGPFAKRGEAEAAAKKIKSLDLPAAILTL